MNTKRRDNAGVEDGIGFLVAIGLGVLLLVLAVCPLAVMAAAR